MAFRFPAVEPYDSGMLDVGDGHQVYWEACGNAVGRPAIYLHGGPGSGSTPDARRHFGEVPSGWLTPRHTGSRSPRWYWLG
jgi:pimeloyl-ACP methyl ester carboxylesterase